MNITIDAEGDNGHSSVLLSNDFVEPLSLVDICIDEGSYVVSLIEIKAVIDAFWEAYKMNLERDKLLS